MDNQTYEVIAARRRYTITQEQIDACSRVIDLATKQVFYQVKSATTDGLVYEVRYNRTFGKLTCTCPAGVYYSTCWHRRAAIKSEELFKQELRAQYEAARREIEASAEYRMEVAQVTAEQARKSYLDGLKEQAAAGDEAAKRELKAYRKHGDRAYESEGFKLEK